MRARPALVDRVLADPTGREYFGRPLWRVADADVIRYRCCLEAAELLREVERGRK